MKKILAGLSSSAADRPVIETALGLAELMGASVDCLHVDGDEALTACEAAGRADLPLRHVEGPVVETLLSELSAPDVVAGVFGARDLPVGPRPAGSTVVAILEQTQTPIVVVPPDAVGPCPRPFCRLLVPLNGSEATAAEASAFLDRITGADVDVLVLNVFGDRAEPSMTDRLDDEWEHLDREFAARSEPGRSVRFESRYGYAPHEVVNVCAQEGADLVIVSWNQNLEGHGEVIRQLLSRAKVPVLVMPIRSAAVAAEARLTSDVSD